MPGDDQMREQSGGQQPSRDMVPARPYADGVSFYDFPAGMAPDPQADGANARRKLTPSMVWRHKWLALAVCLLIVVPGLVTVWTTYVAEYRSQAIIWVKPKRERIVYNTDENRVIGNYKRYLNSQVGLIQSNAVLRRVLEQPAVRNTKWYNDKAAWSEAAPLDRLRKQLTVRPRRDNVYIDIAMTAAVAREAALIADAVVDQYMGYVRNELNKDYDLTTRQLEEEYKSLDQSIKGLRLSIGQTQTLTLVGSPEELLTQQGRRLDAARAGLDNLRYAITLAEYVRNRLRERMAAATQPAARRANGETTVKLLYQSDAEWRQLNRNLMDAQHRAEMGADHFGEENPKMIQLRKEVAFARRSKATRETELDELWENQPADLPIASGDGNSTAAQIARLDEEIDRLEFEASLKEKAVKSEELHATETSKHASFVARERDSLNHLLARFRAVQAEKDTRELEDRAPGTISVLAHAYTPRKPSNGKKRIMMMAMIAALGLGMGIGTACVRAMLAPGIEPAELARVVRAPFLGHLPIVPSNGSDRLRENEILCESVRRIRTSLLQSLNASKGSVVQLTSAGPGAGKTTLSILLAESLARCGKRVLLVDGDLRNPNVCRHCNLEPTPGLVGLLNNRNTDDDVIVALPNSNLHIVPAGELQGGRDLELLSNGALESCLNRWRERYDMVLFDSSPVLLVADAQILAGKVDASIMIVREGRCRRPAVLSALTHISSAGGRLIGVVFLTRRSSDNYYPYSYGAYYAARPGNADLAPLDDRAI